VIREASWLHFKSAMDKKIPVAPCPKYFRSAPERTPRINLVHFRLFNSETQAVSIQGTVQKHLKLQFRAHDVSRFELDYGLFGAAQNACQIEPSACLDAQVMAGPGPDGKDRAGEEPNGRLALPFPCPEGS
jgi:hypothetical protein